MLGIISRIHYNFTIYRFLGLVWRIWSSTFFIEKQEKKSKSGGVLYILRHLSYQLLCAQSQVQL